jgi:hypothetical protein
MALLEESDENFIVSNLEDEKEYLWLAKTIDRFTKRTDELISKARELAKPQVGILVYDEFSDSYILNSTTGAILLKTKEVVKQIASTKIDLTNVLFNLRKGITQQEFGNENYWGKQWKQLLVTAKKLRTTLTRCRLKLMKLNGSHGFKSNSWSKMKKCALKVAWPMSLTKWISEEQLLTTGTSSLIGSQLMSWNKLTTF